jgi:hypothetical protein
LLYDPGFVSRAEAAAGEYTVTFSVADGDGAPAPTPDTVAVVGACDLE